MTAMDCTDLPSADVHQMLDANLGTLMMPLDSDADPSRAEDEHRLEEARRQAQLTGTSTPLVKNELRLKLLHRNPDIRKSEDSAPRNYEMSEEEKNKRERRKDQNRRAAKKCRQKKKNVESDITKSYQTTQARHTMLTQQLEALQRWMNRLQPWLMVHATLCNFVPPPSTQGPPPSTQGPPSFTQGPPPSTQGPPPSTQGPPPSTQGPPSSTQGPPPHVRRDTELQRKGPATGQHRPKSGTHVGQFLPSRRDFGQSPPDRQDVGQHLQGQRGFGQQQQGHQGFCQQPQGQQGFGQENQDLQRVAPIPFSGSKESWSGQQQDEIERLHPSTEIKHEQRANSAAFGAYIGVTSFVSSPENENSQGFQPGLADAASTDLVLDSADITDMLGGLRGGTDTYGTRPDNQHLLNSLGFQPNLAETSSEILTLDYEDLASFGLSDVTVLQGLGEAESRPNSSTPQTSDVHPPKGSSFSPKGPQSLNTTAWGFRQGVYPSCSFNLPASFSQPTATVPLHQTNPSPPPYHHQPPLSRSASQRQQPGLAPDTHTLQKVSNRPSVPISPQAPRGGQLPFSPRRAKPSGCAGLDHELPFSHRRAKPLGSAGLDHTATMYLPPGTSSETHSVAQNPLTQLSFSSPSTSSFISFNSTTSAGILPPSYASSFSINTAEARGILQPSSSSSFCSDSNATSATGIQSASAMEVSSFSPVDTSDLPGYPFTNRKRKSVDEVLQQKTAQDQSFPGKKVRSNTHPTRSQQATQGQSSTSTVPLQKIRTKTQPQRQRRVQATPDPQPSTSLSGPENVSNSTSTASFDVGDWLKYSSGKMTSGGVIERGAPAPVAAWPLATSSSSFGTSSVTSSPNFLFSDAMALSSLPAVAGSLLRREAQPSSTSPRSSALTPQPPPPQQPYNTPSTAKTTTTTTTTPLIIPSSEPPSPGGEAEVPPPPSPAVESRSSQEFDESVILIGRLPAPRQGMSSSAVELQENIISSSSAMAGRLPSPRQGMSSSAVELQENIMSSSSAMAGEACVDDGYLGSNCSIAEFLLSMASSQSSQED